MHFVPSPESRVRVFGMRNSFSSVLLGLLCCFCGAYAGETNEQFSRCSGTPRLESRANGLVFADGTGLPKGAGIADDGAQIYRQRCRSCHGDEGKGAIAVELVGTHESLAQPFPVKAVGSYWYAAPTLLSFIQQSMPPQNINGSEIRLSNDESYAVAAYILSLNNLWQADAVLDAKKLSAIQMPNRNGFNDSVHAKQANSYQIQGVCNK